SVVGFALGTVLALMRLSRSPLLQSVSWTYTWVFRSVPLLLQLLLWYNLAYLYPHLSLGIPFGPEFVWFDTLSVIDKFWAAILGLGLSQAAYSAEIVRAGILSVDQGQQEAAASLGIPRRRQVSRIILPQAMRSIIPTAVNEVIGLLKGTSIVYVLAYGELFYIVSVIYGRNGRVVPLLIVASIWYLVLTTLITVVQYYVERHYAKGAVRTLPPTPPGSASPRAPRARRGVPHERPRHGHHAPGRRGGRARRDPRRPQELRHARGAARRVAHRPARVRDGRARPVRLGQVDAPARDQPPGEGRPGLHLHRRRARRVPPQGQHPARAQGARDPRAAHPDRVRLPELQPVPAPHRARERRRGARLRAAATPRGRPARGPRAARPRRALRQSRRAAAHALTRLASTTM